MPVTLGGISSGIDTDDIIKKLVNVESQQIVKAQRDKSELQAKKKALQSYNTILLDLQKSAKELYGFRASYNDKKGLSSQPGILEATASKLADKGTTKLKVMSLASSHKLTTDPVEKSIELPAAQFDFEVNGENHSVKFRGGDIIKLKEKIDESASAIVSVSSVNVEGDKHVITFESKTPGKKGEIRIKGDTEFLKKIGLVTGEKDDQREKVSMIFDGRYFSKYTGEKKPEVIDGSLSVSGDGKSVSLTGVQWQEYQLPVPAEVKKNTLLQIGMQYLPPKKEDADDGTVPYKVETGPDRTTTIKGIELRGYKISRERGLDQKGIKPGIDDVIGVGVVTEDNGARKEKIYKIAKDAKGVQEFPIGAEFEGKKISKVIFYCNDGEVKFNDGMIATPLDKKGLLEPKNLISEAKDAKIKVDGVEVTRNKNDGISDVIKGVTLNLKGISDKDDITVTVENDMAPAIKKINDFIEKYNKYVDVTESLTKTAKMEKPGDYSKLKNDSGLFIGDMTIIRLSNQLKTIVGSAYPSRAEKPLKTLYQIGINTGKINAAWETIKEGKLNLDETLLKESIMNNPEGVSDLFGSDTDGDSRIDNGLAYVFENSLDPYVRPGKNIMVAKIAQQDDAMKSRDKFIDQQTDHLKVYEEKLRRRFATMEKAVSQSKGQQNWMKQQMGQGSSGKKDN